VIAPEHLWHAGRYSFAFDRRGHDPVVRRPFAGRRRITLAPGRICTLLCLGPLVVLRWPTADRMGRPDAERRD
jgi:hypothetical protein